MMTCGIGEGGDVFRKRLRQLDKSGRAPPDTVIIEVAQPKAIATYYKGAGTIDRHNRICADELRMDRNLGTKHLDKRFNLGVLGIICINAYLFFQQVVHADNNKISCLEFFCKLIDELINNNEGICLTRATAEQEAGAVVDAAAASTPTIRRTLRLKHSNGERGTSCSGKVQHQGLHEALYLCLQREHTSN